jgi:hypothetical protein
MRHIAISFLLIGLLLGCAKTTSVEKEISTTVSGEMLFSGPNSLQAPISIDPKTLAEEFSIASEDLYSIGVTTISISLDGEQAAIAESLLLQVVSDNNEMTALGTLSPLENGTSFELNVAEETDLLPFIQDDGATWVLDVNLSEDIMDEMRAEVNLKLTINHKN